MKWNPSLWTILEPLCYASYATLVYGELGLWILLITPVWGLNQRYTNWGRITRAFRKQVKPRPFQKRDLVLRILRGLVGDSRWKFRPSWSGPYVIWELTPKGVAWLTDLDGNQFSKTTNVDQLKKYYVRDYGRRMGSHHFG